jgi:hypothetical protein
MLAATCVTRPHVLTSDELHIRYGAYFDLRVPLDQIASIRASGGFHESGMVAVKDDRLSVAVSSRTNMTIELTEPITFVRPLGAVARATSIRFFADDPQALLRAHRSGPAPAPAATA